MGSKKPRRHMELYEEDQKRQRRGQPAAPRKTRTQMFDEEYKTCQFRGGCKNVVLVKDHPPGRVLCILHRETS